MPKFDNVKKPKHYNSHPSGVQCIDITRHMNFNCGNAVKYIWRNGLKDGNPSVQDLKKAVWYLQDEIARLEKLRPAKAVRAKVKRAKKRMENVRVKNKV